MLLSKGNNTIFKFGGDLRRSQDFNQLHMFMNYINLMKFSVGLSKTIVIFSDICNRFPINMIYRIKLCLNYTN